MLSPCSAETRIFQENYVNTIATDALAAYVAKSSEVMRFTAEDKEILVFKHLHHFSVDKQEKIKIYLLISLTHWGRDKMAAIFHKHFQMYVFSKCMNLD